MVKLGFENDERWRNGDFWKEEEIVNDKRVKLSISNYYFEIDTLLNGIVIFHQKIE